MLTKIDIDNDDLKKGEDMNKKKKLLTVLGVFAIIAIILVLLSNTSGIINGNVYYYDSNGAHRYNVITKTRHDIKLDGYSYVSRYLPTKDGYFAVVSDGEECKLISNDKIIFDDVAYNLQLINNYLIFQSELIYAYNFSTDKLYQLSFENESIDAEFARAYSFFCVDNYVCFDNRDRYSNEDEYEITVVDCNSDEPIPKVIDTGRIYRNTESSLIYKKNEKCYEYDFINEKSIEIDAESLKEPELQKRYLGKISIGKKEYDIHFDQLTWVLDKENYKSLEDYEFLLMSEPSMLYYDIKGYGFIRIHKGIFSLWIPTYDSSFLTYNLSFGNVCAYKRGGKIYYPRLTSQSRIHYH